MVGLRQNLDEFTELLLQKLFMKRDGEATDKFKYIIKQDTTHKRIDRSRPLYMDDLKRFGKLKEIGEKKQFKIISQDSQNIKRDYEEVNIFNMDSQTEELKNMEKLRNSIKKTQTKIKELQSTKLGEDKQVAYSGAWYLPVKKWGRHKKYNYEDKEVNFASAGLNVSASQNLLDVNKGSTLVGGISQLTQSTLSLGQNKDKHHQIGELTKQALQYLLNPYKEETVRRTKLHNKDDLTAGGSFQSKDQERSLDRESSTYQREKQQSRSNSPLKGKY